MQEGANPNCPTCCGEGEEYRYFANHKIKAVTFEWQYCQECFPNSRGYWPSGNWEEINSLKFEQLEKEGYRDFTGC